MSGHAGEPRWRAPVLALLQSLKRRADVERILEAIRDEPEGEPDSTDRRLLLADGAFATASVSGAVGRQAALDSLSRIEAGTDDAEGLELLGLALDGPRAGPIGEAIVTRLARWWPGVTEWQANLYAQLGTVAARRRNLRRRCNSHSGGQEPVGRRIESREGLSGGAPRLGIG